MDNFLNFLNFRRSLFRVNLHGVSWLCLPTSNYSLISKSKAKKLNQDEGNMLLNA